MKIPERIKSMGVAMFGQGLNFAAMLLPVVGKEAGQLAYLMFPLSLSALLYKLGTLSFHVRYLTLSKEDRGIGTATSTIGLALTTLVLGVIGLLVWPISPHWGQVLVWSALLTFSHGVFYMAVTVAIAEGREGFYGKVRFVYGVLNFALTAVVVWLVPFQAGLVLVALAITLLGGLLILIVCENKLLPVTISNVRAVLSKEGLRYLNQSRPTTRAVLVADLGFQFQGFLTPLMGNYQELWALVLRLTGGFGTIGQQVFAPFFEGKIAAAILEKDVSGAEKQAWRAQLFGFTLAILSVPIQIGSVLFAVEDKSTTSLISLVMISIYTVGTLINSINLKAPYFFGYERFMFYFSTVKIIILVPLFLANGQLLLFLVSIFQLCQATVLIPVSLKAKPDRFTT